MVVLDVFPGPLQHRVTQVLMPAKGERTIRGKNIQIEVQIRQGSFIWPQCWPNMYVKLLLQYFFCGKNI